MTDRTREDIVMTQAEARDRAWEIVDELDAGGHFNPKEAEAAAAVIAFAILEAAASTPALVNEARFLAERLREYEPSCQCEEACREWQGHVCPSLERLETLVRDTVYQTSV